ncbi:hypothetical protein B0H16DRAFT_1469576 [Mycena metata]|uniref:Uncharacterized protein n=1 Tax=Mycena metata TaxID=1033252 RepID=A0AAD7MTU6_9AGAR|nr:hypothetical protein B0H16DRAFT_1469576 [Mycena metata]
MSPQALKNRVATSDEEESRVRTTHFIDAASPDADQVLLDLRVGNKPSSNGPFIASATASLRPTARPKRKDIDSSYKPSTLPGLNGSFFSPPLYVVLYHRYITTNLAAYSIPTWVASRSWACQTMTLTPVKHPARLEREAVEMHTIAETNGHVIESRREVCQRQHTAQKVPSVHLESPRLTMKQGRKIYAGRLQLNNAPHRIQQFALAAITLSGRDAPELVVPKIKDADGPACEQADAGTPAHLQVRKVVVNSILGLDGSGSELPPPGIEP